MQVNPTYAQIRGAYLQLLNFRMIGAVVKFHVCATRGPRIRQHTHGDVAGRTVAIPLKSVVMLLLANACIYHYLPAIREEYWILKRNDKR